MVHFDRFLQSTKHTKYQKLKQEVTKKWRRRRSGISSNFSSRPQRQANSMTNGLRPTTKSRDAPYPVFASCLLAGRNAYLPESLQKQDRIHAQSFQVRFGKGNPKYFLKSPWNLLHNDCYFNQNNYVCMK